MYQDYLHGGTVTLTVNRKITVSREVQEKLKRISLTCVISNVFQ